MCGRCEELEDEVTWLRERVGEQINEDLLGSLRVAFGVTGGEARLLATLFQAATFLSRDVLTESVKIDQAADVESRLVDVLVLRARKRLGRGAIETIRGAGYRLSSTGRQQIIDALLGNPSTAPNTDYITERYRKVWSDETVLEIARLRRQHASYGQIGAVFGVSRSTIASVCRRRVDKVPAGVAA